MRKFLVSSFSLLAMLATVSAQQTAPAKSAAKAPAKAKTQAAQPMQSTPTIVIRGGKVMTVTHGTIENGVVVM